MLRLPCSISAARSEQAIINIAASPHAAAGGEPEVTMARSRFAMALTAAQADRRRGFRAQPSRLRYLDVKTAPGGQRKELMINYTGSPSK